jgi:hypothetical protein
MVAAYAFALQALLGAVLVSQNAVAASDPFVICYAGDDGAPADHGNSQARDTCALCTLAKVSHAFLGVAETSLRAPFVFSSIRISQAIEQIDPFHSPTGQYQTGPPRAALAV